MKTKQEKLDLLNSCGFEYEVGNGGVYVWNDKIESTPFRVSDEYLCGCEVSYLVQEVVSYIVECELDKIDFIG